MRRSISCPCVAMLAIVLGTVSQSSAQGVIGLPRRVPARAQVTPRPSSGLPASLDCRSAPTARPFRTQTAVVPRPAAAFPLPLFPLPLDPRYYPSYEPTYDRSLDSSEASRRLALPAPQVYPSKGATPRMPQPRKLPLSSAADRELAAELIARGDERFARGSYSSAVGQYKQAIRTAPEMADAQMRIALALIAQRKYKPATAALFAALDLRPDWSDSQLRLDQLYAPAALTKTTRLLERLVENNPMNGEFALLLATQLYFSDLRDESTRYFTRAVQLGADNRNRLAALRSPDLGGD